MLRQRRNRRSDDAGFSIIELMVVTSIMAIVLVVAGGALISLMQATNRDDARVGQEQAISTTLANLARDIRSSQAVSIPAGTTAANGIELKVNNPGGGTSTIDWVFNQTAGTMTRTNGSGQMGWTVSQIGNSGSTPVFHYYNDQGTDISTSPNATIGACTTRVGVQLVVASSQPGVPTFTESDDVTLTDQLQVLSAPGNGQC